jgi:hypothetical protein
MNPLAAVIRQIDRLLETYPELADDDLLRLDTIEGNTDALDIANRLARLEIHSTAMADAVKAEIDALSKRKQRYLDRKAAARLALQTLLSAIGSRKLELPSATVSLTKRAEGVKVTDVDALPQGYYKTERKADLDAIKKAIKSGDDLPGVERTPAGESLTIRSN